MSKHAGWRSGSRWSLRAALIAVLAAALGGPVLAQPKVPVETLEVTPELVKAAQQEGKLYMRYSAPTDSTDAILAAFKRKYGIDAIGERRVAAEGTNTFLAEERAGRHIVDIHVNTDRRGMLALVRDGYYTPYRVKNHDQFDPSVRLENYAYAPYATNAVLAYHTKKLDPATAEKLFSGTWKGLLDPRFKGGRIGIISPFITSATSLWFWALAESPKYGKEFLQAVAKMDPIVFPDQAVGEEALHAGEVDILIGEPQEPAWNALARGASIAWVYPDTLASVPSVMHFISTKAPHPKAARLFMAWLLSPEGAAAISVDGGRAPTIKATVPMNPRIKAALDAAPWWKPYPANVRFTPSIPDIVAKEDGYRKQMAEMFRISTRR